MLGREGDGHRDTEKWRLAVAVTPGREGCHGSWSLTRPSNLYFLTCWGFRDLLGFSCPRDELPF